SEHGRRTVLSELSRLFRTRVGTVVSVTRNTPNPLRAQADLALVVSGHDDRPHVEPLLYQAALQQLLDLLFVLLCEHGEERLRLLDQDAARICELLESCGRHDRLRAVSQSPLLEVARGARPAAGKRDRTGD